MDEPASPLAHLEPLRARYGVSCSLDEFQRAVNLAFHECESEVYDQIHEDMWRSLPQQFNLLASDIAPVLPSDSLRVLDVGCGTGLSAELLLRSPIGSRVASIHLLDTSAQMLERARHRLSNRSCEVQITQGLLDATFPARSIDVVVTCSVLHHIPDLESFIDDVTRIQRPGAVFLHFQDPNADAASDLDLARRTNRLTEATQSRIPKSLRRLSPRRVWSAMARRFGKGGGGTYIDRTNAALIRGGYITRAMTPPDIWAVTDIHDNHGDGISLSRLAGLLREHQLVSSRTYAFFSKLISTLPADFQEEEARLIEQRAQSGHYLAAAWKKR